MLITLSYFIGFSIHQLVLMGGAMLSKSLIQFSIDGWICVPSLLFTWTQTMVEVMKIKVTSFKDPMQVLLHSVPPTLQQATSSPHLYCRLLDTGRQVWVSLCGATAFSWALMHRVLLYPPRVYFPVLCNFWQLCGGVNGDLLQEGLCHTLVCCTQSPCPCCSSLLTRTSTGDAQTQFCLSLCGVPGWASDKLKLELQLHLLENKTKDFNSQPVEKCEYKS